MTKHSTLFIAMMNSLQLPVLVILHGRLCSLCMTDGRLWSQILMASSKPKGVRTPFQDLTNVNNSGKYITNTYLIQPCAFQYHLMSILFWYRKLADPNDLKRQKERERYAHDHVEINRKKCEAWHHPIFYPLRNMMNSLCQEFTLLIMPLGNQLSYPSSSLLIDLLHRSTSP